MTDRIEELAKMAYEAESRFGRAQAWEDKSPEGKEGWLRIVRTLYAAIMTEAAGVAQERQAFFLRRSNEREGPAEVFELARGNAAQTIAHALLAKAKESAP